MANKSISRWGFILLTLLISVILITGCQQILNLDIEAVQSSTTLPAPTNILTPTRMTTNTATAVVTHLPATPVPSSTAKATQSPIPTIPPTQTPPEESMTFAVIGDYGFTGQGTFDVAAMVEQWQPDIVLTVGDNNYPNGAAFTISDNITQHYGAFIAENRFYPALGNHDYHTELAQPYLDYFDLTGNERYYDFVWGDAHFFAVDSDWQQPDGIRSDSRQAQWLQAQLAASDATWQIVYFHAPPFVSNADKIVPVMNWPFAAWGADIVFSGHAHLYERLTVDGIPYIVNGLGGHSIYNFDDTPHPASEVQYNGDFGAVFVEVNSSQLMLQFVNRAGSVIDVYTVLRP